MPVDTKRPPMLTRSAFASDPGPASSSRTPDPGELLSGAAAASFIERNKSRPPTPEQIARWDAMMTAHRAARSPRRA